ncbi:MAG: SpoIIE family protein phosphatase [Chloroflexi bacterium]|nr:SpoIIE family protein phosphatase [Chloroflexota bacterium]
MSEQDDKTKRMKMHLPDMAGGAMDKGPVRKANEDAFMLPEENAPTDLGRIYIVADGVGGQEHGAEAAQLAVRIIHDLFYQTRQVGESATVALRHAAEQANLAIYDEAQTRGAGRMGCTAVTAVHHQNQRLILHAGDARAYLLRDGELRQLTKDDTWVQRQVDEGLIGEDTAQHHELRHVVTRVLGNKPEVELTVSEPSSIEPGDILLLCSDGLHDAVSKKQIQQILSGYSPQAAAETLVQAAYANAKDNITAVVVASQPEEPEHNTVAMSTVVAAPPEPPKETANAAAGATTTTVPHRRRQGIRLPLWALVAIALTIILSIILGASTLWRRLRPTNEPEPTVAAIAATPISTAVPAIIDTAVPPPTSTLLPTNSPPATPTIIVAAPAESTPPSEPEGTAVSNLACIVSPGAVTFVWQDFQINGSNCDQFAAEEFVFNDGDQVVIVDPEPIGVLGPDATCLANQFIKIRSVANPAIEGWALVNNVKSTTPEQGCPSP